MNPGRLLNVVEEARLAINTFQGPSLQSQKCLADPRVVAPDYSPDCRS